MAHLITGYKGEEHIQSADQGSFNASFFGTGQYVMEAGNQMEASIIDNNTVRIVDGDILMKGRHIRIAPNTFEDLSIDTGTAGRNRNDLIVMRYEKNNGSGIELASLVVIKGTETEGTPTDPSYTNGDILAGALVNDMPLYRVKIEGVVLTEVEQLFSTLTSFGALAEKYEQEFIEACNSHLDSLNILDTKEEILANTQTNQLAGALAVKEIANSKQDASTAGCSLAVNGTTVQLKNGNGVVLSSITTQDTKTPVTNNLTSTSSTNALSANQGRLLANGSARDSTKLPLSGGYMTGNLGFDSGKGIVGDVSGLNITNLRNLTGANVGSNQMNGVTISNCVGLNAPENVTEWFVFRVGNGALSIRNGLNNAYKPINASAFTVQSSKKYKENIEDMTDDYARKILELRPVSYDYINKEDGVDCYGLIAEEVAEIETYPVSYMDEQIEGLDYSKFVPQLIKMIQIQQEEIDALKVRIETLEKGK